MAGNAGKSSSTGGSRKSSSRSSSRSSSTTKVDDSGKTPAELELEQSQSGPDGDDQAQQDAAKAAHDEQVAELKAGRAAGKLADQHFSDLTVPEQRSGGVLGAKPIAGRVDNMTRRSDADAIEGHFVYIDFSNEEFGDAAREAVEAALPDGSRVGNGSADFGVYTTPGELGEDGYPLTAVVMLRDEHAMQVTVPYGALVAAPAGSGGRR